MKDQKKLEVWQERYRLAEQAYASQRSRMKRREDLVDGSHDIYKPDGTKADKKATHVRNVCFEIVETQVDSNIPQPKVSAVRQEDEELAKRIEDMLRNLLDRLPMERINDEAERICPTQGGYAFLLDWDSQAAGRDWMGQLTVSLLHPRKILPQDGIYQVRDMDYLFVMDAQSKLQLKRRYGVDLTGESEEDPDIRAEGASSTTDELVTMITAYYRNDKGGIGRLRWVGDTLLEDLEDYQARRVKLCRRCGAVGDGIRCGYCGGTAFREELQEYEEMTDDLVTGNQTVIPAESQKRDEFGQPVFRDVERPELETDFGTGDLLLDQMRPGTAPAGIYSVRQEPVMEATRIPYYKPDIYPVVLRKNVSKTGQFLGGSDIDAIQDQQNSLNKATTKMNRKVLGGGSFVTKPEGLGAFISDDDNRVLTVRGPKDLECIRTFNTQVNISADMALMNEYYEEARQTIGITDSMQGRRDPTATSKIAKEFSAQQASGRLESKRVMKNAVFQDLFEAMFKFMLAYADEPRRIISYNEQGEREYKVFDRHDFLYQDEAGNWKYNTDFLFSVDSSAPLAANREAMWQEARMNLQEGAYGSPTELRSLVRFWTIMERLHYPTAKEIKADLQEELEEQRAAQEQQQMMGQQAMGGTGGGLPQMTAAPAEAGQQFTEGGAVL